MAKKSNTHIRKDALYRLTLLRGYHRWLYWGGESGNSDFGGPTEKNLIGEYFTIQDARMVAYGVMSKYIGKDVMVLVKYAGSNEIVGSVEYTDGTMIWTKSAPNYNKSYMYHILNRDGTLGKGWTN